MDVLMQELSLDMPDRVQMMRAVVRLVMAVLLAAVIGFQRERSRHAAGLRTHILVSLGAAMFTLIPLEAGAHVSEVTRTIQGIAAGVGFIGGGVILKLDAQRQVTGLTTAATIWLAAAIGVAAGLGRIGAALVSVILAWLVLVALGPLEQRWHLRNPEGHPQHDAASIIAD